LLTVRRCDTTHLIVCHNKGIFDHKVFKDLAKTGKSSVGLGSPDSFLDSNSMPLINEWGQLMVFKITYVNVTDK